MPTGLDFSTALKRQQQGISTTFCLSNNLTCSDSAKELMKLQSSGIFKM
jgi:hypothetical protein